VKTNIAHYATVITDDYDLHGSFNS
ncbi:MAG: hypothetical protein ACI8SJ_002188, partial [Shewanella sp.]